MRRKPRPAMPAETFGLVYDAGSAHVPAPANSACACRRVRRMGNPCSTSGSRPGRDRRIAGGGNARIAGSACPPGRSLLEVKRVMLKHS